jgi:hypothetical protein
VVQDGGLLCGLCRLSRVFGCCIRLDRSQKCPSLAQYTYSAPSGSARKARNSILGWPTWARRRVCSPSMSDWKSSRQRSWNRSNRWVSLVRVRSLRGALLQTRQLGVSTSCKAIAYATPSPDRRMQFRSNHPDLGQSVRDIVHSGSEDHEMGRLSEEYLIVLLPWYDRSVD